MGTIAEYLYTEEKNQIGKSKMMMQQRKERMVEAILLG